ncbi:adaptor protein MecA [Listeria monocytogenes]|uniref:adaptor protein MecA n=1 Tax=Listeria monocytogenes TaxID=1639 RepID=UPI0010B08AC0|nr:adaptor protein MecA [Listeria monocytogenes]EAC2554268.1 adaptor protein MecA [Listeria monocytogenes]EAC3931715.1 adaptor protein MecA [Listeria monocytogenes]EAC3940749.1 adaptor protein MecA [Listeria monocytogenes]EAC5500426.1 adaptor protein MecA [Listeria monocytogenes]EAC5615212.1 adaptor protein MecA [Listeria monocytogenes]
MEIERINEDTIKFYISYLDLEERGFNQEDVWYDREKSEELFWDMMDELKYEEEFSPEGPLWIQVQALKHGLEVFVTKATIGGKGEDDFDVTLSSPDELAEEKIEKLLEENFNPVKKEALGEDDTLEFILEFRDFEDAISLSRATGLENLVTKLYSYQGKYYLNVEFPENKYDESNIDNAVSILLEYGLESNLTGYMLAEYGKVIFDVPALKQIRKHF